MTQIDQLAAQDYVYIKKWFTMYYITLACPSVRQKMVYYVLHNSRMSHECSIW